MQDLVVSSPNHNKELVERFLVKFARSEKTVKSYRLDLTQYLSFLEKNNIRLSDVRPYHVEQWKYEIGHLAPKSINRKISAVKSFYKWIVAQFGESWAPVYNPLTSVEFVKNASVENPTYYLHNQEVIDMIESCDVNTNRGNFERLAFILMAYLGLRANEVARLKVGNIVQTAENVILKVHGKGGRCDMMPLSSFLVDEIMDYIKRFNLSQNRNFPTSGKSLAKIDKRLLGPDDYLAQSLKYKSDKPVPYSHLNYAVKRHAEKLGIARPVSPHSFRRSYATQLHEQGFSIQAISKAMRHADIKTTMEYIKSLDDLNKHPALVLDYGKPNKPKFSNQHLLDLKETS